MANLVVLASLPNVRRSKREKTKSEASSEASSEAENKSLTTEFNFLSTEKPPLFFLPLQTGSAIKGGKEAVFSLTDCGRRKRGGSTNRIGTFLRSSSREICQWSCTHWRRHWRRHWRTHARTRTCRHAVNFWARPRQRPGVRRRPGAVRVEHETR